jgi:hypothetical protein
LPSLQGVPSGALGLEHLPVVGSQAPVTWHASLAVQVTGVWPQSPVPGLQAATWHASLAAQVTGFEPVHTPDVQASVWVQRLPSLQGVPSGALGLEHLPVVGSQAPATWHASLAVQVTGVWPQSPVLGLQAATWHASLAVHTVSQQTSPAQ